MSIKHTPGPWKIYKEESATECWYPKGLLYVGPCIIGTECESITPQNYVDARLIAAAPKLLKASKIAQFHLKRFAELMPGSYHLDDMKSLNEAINEAGGKE